MQSDLDRALDMLAAEKAEPSKTPPQPLETEPAAPAQPVVAAQPAPAPVATAEPELDDVAELKKAMRQSALMSDFDDPPDGAVQHIDPRKTGAVLDAQAEQRRKRSLVGRMFPSTPERLEKHYGHAFAWANDVRYINTKNKARTVLHFADRSVLHDYDNRVQTHKAEPGVAARRVVDMAKAKGWGSLELFGSPDYLEKAFVAALDAGLEVRAQSPEQEKLFKAVLKKQGMKPKRLVFGAPSADEPNMPAAPTADDKKPDEPASTADTSAPVPSRAGLAQRLDERVPAAKKADAEPAAPARKSGRRPS